MALERKVLVVDDDEQIGALMNATLGDYDVTIVTGWQAADQAMQGEKFPVVLLDKSMPDAIDDPYARIRELYEDNPFQPQIISVTGGPGGEPEEVKVLTKPFTPPALREAVDEAYEKVEQSQS